VLATVVARRAPQSARSGAKALVAADGALTGWIGGGCVRGTVVREALAALRDGQPRLLRINPEAEADPRPEVRVYAMTCEGEGAVDVYLEPVLPAEELLVLGRTPVAEALAELARPLGFVVRIADPHLEAARFPGAAELLADLARVPARLRPRSHVVVATMGEGDEEALRAALSADVAYLGLVASRRKGRALLAHFVGDEALWRRAERVKYPAGLDFGAATPAEIALSILAEIVQRLRSGAPAAPRVPALALRPAPEEEATALDPVCGMAVEVGTARHTHAHEGTTYYFCCPHCRAHFARDPARWLATAGR
jgi:xanthine dehydrogenase accessory factor